MKATTAAIMLFASFCHPASFCQTIQQIFFALPAPYTPSLSTHAKDSLVRFGSYTFPGGNAEETKVCTYSSDTDNHLILEYTFNTGQDNFSITQLRKLLKSDGKPCVVYARYGGSARSFRQQELRIFTYANNVLAEDHSIMLPSILQIRDFCKAGTSEVTILECEKLISTSYDLKPAGFDAIEYVAYPQTESIIESLEAEVFRFIWDGKGFKKTVGER